MHLDGFGTLSSDVGCLHGKVLGEGAAFDWEGVNCLNICRVLGPGGGRDPAHSNRKAIESLLVAGGDFSHPWEESEVVRSDDMGSRGCDELSYVTDA